MDLIHNSGSYACTKFSVLTMAYNGSEQTKTLSALSPLQILTKKPGGWIHGTTGQTEVLLQAVCLHTGHADFLIHSGEAAVILPQEVNFFAKREVTKIAASKHHSAAITAAGELFTWGSNRDGRLGYPAADTQPTPRKYASFQAI